MSYISDFCAGKKNFLQYEDMRKIFGVSGGGQEWTPVRLAIIAWEIASPECISDNGLADWSKAVYKKTSIWEKAVNECFHPAVLTDLSRIDVLILWQEGGTSRISFQSLIFNDRLFFYCANRHKTFFYAG